MEFSSTEQPELSSKLTESEQTQQVQHEQSEKKRNFSFLHMEDLMRSPMPRTPPLAYKPLVSVSRVVADLTRTNTVAINVASDLNYLTLKDAAKDSGYSEIELLKFASNEKIKLCIQVSKGMDFRPFDNSNEQQGIPLYFPDKLILEPSYCKQISERHKTEQSDFKKSYVLRRDKPSMMLPGCANLDKNNEEKYVWRAFHQAIRHHITITKEDVFIAKDEFQYFIRENPKELESLPTKIEVTTPTTNPFDNTNVASSAGKMKGEHEKMPPGKIPRVAIGKLAIKAAWEIECETERYATADEVMKRLQIWAALGNEGFLKKATTFGVVWTPTRTRIPKEYKPEACGKTLEMWYKSRA